MSDWDLWPGSKSTIPALETIVENLDQTAQKVSVVESLHYGVNESYISESGICNNLASFWRNVNQITILLLVKKKFEFFSW